MPSGAEASLTRVGRLGYELPMEQGRAVAVCGYALLSWERPAAARGDSLPERQRMDFHYTYKVSTPPDALWAFVTDIPAVGMCIPGAEDVAETDGTYTGTVKVRVGPVALGLAGKLWVDSRDDAAMRVSMTGEGADRKVPGNVRVKIEMAVEDAGDGASNSSCTRTPTSWASWASSARASSSASTDGIMQEFGRNLTKRVQG